MIKVAIIEDLQDVAYAMKDLLNSESDISCTQIYHNASDAITFLPRFPVDVVLCDIGLPGMDGIEAMQDIRTNCPQIQFCMFTVFEDSNKIFNSIKAGAKGYILKNAPPDEILHAVRELHAGGSPINPTIARKVMDHFSQMPAYLFKSENFSLTPREKELLELLIRGMYYKEIADVLNITIGTVKQHVHNIYDKLEVANRTEAINRYNYLKTKGNQNT